MICILAAGAVLGLKADAFTLGWTHSVERTIWREEWVAGPEGLRPVSAFIQGTGAGMDLPEGARRVEGGWQYEVRLPPQPEVVLASSGATVGGWSLCAAGECLVLGDRAADPVRLWWDRADCASGLP